MAAAAMLGQFFSASFSLGSYGRREVAMAGVRVVGLLYLLRLVLLKRMCHYVLTHFLNSVRYTVDKLLCGFFRRSVLS